MTISDRKLVANKNNSAKGGEVSRQKAIARYMENPKVCPQCKTMIPYEKRNNQFCSMHCSAIFNNTGVRRHGKDSICCEHCGNKTRNKKYCSIKCSAEARYLSIDEETRALKRKVGNAANQAAYRAKYGYVRAYDPTANKEKIKEIYANCPIGFEVDHIIPLSKGGKHHEDNLQYLTIAENRRKYNK